MTLVPLTARLLAAVEAVPDPELGGVTIGELGMVLSVDVAEKVGSFEAMIELLPTFLGCPALELISSDVQLAARLAGAETATVRFPLSAVRWSPDRISADGVARLNAIGIAVQRAVTPDPPCPRCGQQTLVNRLPVGASSCRSSAWCKSCRDVIDVLRGTDR
jgi:ring-1,2-phenylacetyl-CoA epoxidase subunit PaaD